MTRIIFHILCTARALFMMFLPRGTDFSLGCLQPGDGDSFADQGLELTSELVKE